MMEPSKQQKLQKIMLKTIDDMFKTATPLMLNLYEDRLLYYKKKRGMMV